MLKSVFQAFNISSQELHVLVKLYEQYSKDQGGALYQISMSREQACAMTYAAGSLGVLAPYGGSVDVGQIIMQLQGALGNFTETDRAYVIALQARVLVPPHQLLQTQTVELQDFTVPQLKTFNQNMKRALQDIVRAILTHRNEFNVEDLQQNTPMLRLQAELYKANILAQQTQGSSTSHNVF